MPPYTPFYTVSFSKCVKRHLSRCDQIRALETRILRDPFVSSHALTVKGEVDLRGKRARHDAGGRFVIIYMVCEECLNRGYREAGFNDCNGCEEIPENGVVFLAYGSHDDVYARYWRAHIDRGEGEAKA